MKKNKKISASERDQIAVLLASGISLRNIAKKLGRSVSSISDEINRNSVKGEYKSIAANSLSLNRNRQSRKTNPLKNSKIYSYVFEKLRGGWSPEQIAGRLKKINNNKTVICHETIYRYIYSSDGKKRNLHEYLVRHHRKRRPWYGRYLYRKGIAQRVSIRLRPEEINSKKIFGHWEADVVEGKGHEKGIQTLLERKTRYYQAKILLNIDSEYGVKAQKDILQSFPKKARKSVTFDNGKENYNHLKLQRWFNLKTYFCDPNCAWQKGSNEYHNGILRRYIPQKTDLSELTQFELDEILKEINNMPKKCLGYQTPREAFKKELKCKKCSDST
ncbi:MAG: IS30 family transposase [Patescibacteria group bacterium]|nr:IS30 family transposase [Patescibacteria group bacterium]